MSTDEFDFPSRGGGSVGRVLAWGLLAAGIVVSTFIAAKAWKEVKTRTVRTIEVTGAAKRRITSDLIEWSARVTARGDDQAGAYRQLKDQVEKVLAYLKQQGVTEKELRPSAVTIEPVMETITTGTGETRTQKVVQHGFQTWQEITVQSHQVDKVERVSREVTTLLEAGVAVTSQPPAYYYTKLGEIKVQMLAEAAKDARMRAEQILHSAGSAALGKLRKGDMGIINVNPPNSTATSWEGNNDTSSLEKDMITVVHCEFDVN
jgi:hypothetical protein